VTETVFASPLTEREIIAKEISAALVEAGIKAYRPMFPYGLHHDFYRSLRRKGKHLRHRDVAEALSAWAETRDRASDYVWQAACGAVLALEAADPAIRSRLPPAISVEFERIGWGGDFESWMRSGRPAQTAGAANAAL
jgi:hypothetical protein